MAVLLIVEDDTATNEAICEYMSSAGHTTLSAFDGEQGLQIAREKSIDLVVLDIMLPKRTGLEVLKELRQTSGIPVLMLTALDDEPTQAASFAFPFWDKNALNVSVDGSSKTFSESRLWWPYWRRTCWLSFASGRSLSAGNHTLVISGGVPGVQFYGFRVCSSFSEEPSAGEATFTLSPRQFLDVNGQPATPDKGFRLTCEMLRRKPDSALVWYEDFRDDTPLPDSYWTTLSGEWSVWRESYTTENRPYSLLEGSGRLAWKYEGFSDLHIRARVGFPQNGGGRAGVFLGNLFCCLNYDTQRVELYQGSSLLGSYATSFSKTPDAQLHSDPTVYTIEMRKRGNRVRVYSGSSYTLRFTATVSATAGYAGIQADNEIVCDLLRAGDAWAYEPYECFDVVYPDGVRTSFGRIARSDVTWDEEFQIFSVNSDVDEGSTRSEDISLDYDFFHSHLLEISCGNDYTAKVIPRDINVWTARLFLGDADGFSIRRSDRGADRYGRLGCRTGNLGKRKRGCTGAYSENHF